MKKILSLILALMMISGCIIPAFSAEDDEPVRYYADMSGEEGAGFIPFRIVDRYGNEKKDPSSETKLKAGSAPLLSAENLPTSYDSRNINIVTSVKDQGETSACWAFSTVSCLESDVIKNHGEKLGSTDFSESHLIWFAQNPNTGKGTFRDGINLGKNSYSTGGNWITSVAALSRWVGINNEADFPYSEGAKFDESKRVSYTSDYILDSSVFFDFAKNRDSLVKKWIMDHGSVMVGYYESLNELYRKNDTYYYNGANKANHAVTIIGWDDSFPASSFAANPGMNGAWLVKNSWGKDKKYFWISYMDSSFTNFAGFSAQPNPKNNRESYNFNYSYSSYSCDTSYPSSKVANIYTANGSEVLKAISFYNWDNDSKITASIYKLNKGYSSPEDGTLCCMTSGQYETYGLYTIPLSSAVNLEKGEMFSVVLTYEVKTGKPNIPFESSDKFDASEGQTFVYTSGNWKDVVYISGIKNAPIQALTSCRHENLQILNTTATCTMAGDTTYRCTDCENVFTESGTPLGHNYVLTESKPATCTEAGEGTYTCSRCDDSYVTPVPASHKFGSYVYNNDAKVTTDGTETAVCSACGICDTRTAVGTAKGPSSISTETRIGTATIPYRSTIYFYAVVTNPTGAPIDWYIDDHKVTPGPDPDNCLVVKDVKETFVIHCVTKDFDGNEIYSEKELIVVDDSLLAKFIAFFKWLFGILPVYDI